MRSDEELIEAYLGGEEAVFATLVKRHLKTAYAFATRLSGSTSEAEDIVQESFLKAWKSLKRYDPESASFKTWLMRIVRNTTIDYLRKKKHVPFSTFAGEEGESVFANIPDESLGALELAARAYDARAVEQAVATLTVPYREVLALHYGEGLTFDEMATVLATSANTLKSRHRRALAALRQALHPRLTA